MTAELPGIPSSAAPLALADLLPRQRALLHVATNDRAMDQLAATLPFFAADVEIIRFPSWDCLPFDRVSPRPALVAERVQALAQLAARRDEKPLIVLTTASAILQKVPPASLMREAMLPLAPGQTIARDALIAFLSRSGYRRAGKAIEPGEFALRGSIVDIMPPGMTQGVRLDFFGDTIESMRSFDPMTQLSAGPLPRLTLHPAGEIALGEESIGLFRNAYRERFGAVNRDDPLYEAVSAGQHYPGMEHWLPLFFERLDTLADYLPQAQITLDSESEAAIAERQETIRDYYEARLQALKQKNAAAAAYHPLPPELFYLMGDAWKAVMASHNAVQFSPFGGESHGWKAAPSLAAERHQRSSSEAVAHPTITDQNPFAQLNAFAATRGKPVLLACLSAGSCERIAQLLLENGIETSRASNWSQVVPQSKQLLLAALPLEHGFETPNAVIISEQDWLGERIIRASAKKRKTETFLAEAANFHEGELVVHREHGIGRFTGLVTVEVLGAKHDCLGLVYEGGDKLFLPVENIELLSRYGSEEEGAKLDRLGAASWQARKARMKERIRLAAEALLKTAALRQLKHAPILESAVEKYHAFTARFGFVETDDQARSIEDVLADLDTGRPMDRLVCGDVGFGKTEVAMRAAFVATHAVPKVQVALVVPTTLLARQHYKNFRERFEGLNVRVAQLSRMVNALEQKRVREGLKDGSIDIVIGTHALLAKSVQFANLGLLIIDEEQHFGVGQKEKLKELKTDVHVLTLSATPIPRTLQMALSGVRSLSLIATPPVDRLAVRSFVMPFDPVVLREAILRERHRNGRVFVVTPRIKDIAELKVQLAELVPEAKIGVAHGQMTPGELDSVMNDFYDGKFDLLLSTAIIESGLDIPQANTLIVHRSDRFGLAQLYQLRGRVGRGKLRAYAYFLLPPHRELTKNATKRLEVMQSLDELGAGFTLASHDMDIRGFGNLVGEEQSGHIREVGIELYQQMLEEAVAALKSERKDAAPSEEWSPQINLGLSVLIPEDYVEDLDLRMGLYRRAAMLLSPEELDAFAAEMVDRFGPLPETVHHLLDTVRLKQLCKRAGIARLDAGPKGAVLSFHQDKFAKPDALLNYITKRPTLLKLRPDQKLVAMKEWRENAACMKDIAALLKDIAGLKAA